MELSAITEAIREMSFDRFTTPSLFIKGGVSDFVRVASDRIEVSNQDGSTVYETFLYSTYETIGAITEALMQSNRNYTLQYAGAYIPSEPSSAMLPMSRFNVAEFKPLFRTRFFSDTAIFETIKDYYLRVLTYGSMVSRRILESATDEEITDVVEDLGPQQTKHLVLWCAYQLVDKRRLYEAASEYISQSNYEGMSGAGVVVTGGGSSSIRVNIGDVFTLEEQLGDSFNKNETPNQVGADNVLGDARSFWYRLMLWLRKQIEDIYGDFSLRPNQAFAGTIDLERPLNFYAYFDSYPYYISPLTRRIMDLPSSANWG